MSRNCYRYRRHDRSTCDSVPDSRSVDRVQWNSLYICVSPRSCCNSQEDFDCFAADALGTRVAAICRHVRARSQCQHAVCCCAHFCKHITVILCILSVFFCRLFQCGSQVNTSTQIHTYIHTVFPHYVNMHIKYTNCFCTLLALLFGIWYLPSCLFFFVESIKL